MPIPPQLWIRIGGEDSAKEIREDDYGDELTFAYAQELRKLRIEDQASPWNTAIKAFIEALPEQTPIILFWD